jgi:hypothetical protein
LVQKELTLKLNLSSGPRVSDRSRCLCSPPGSRYFPPDVAKVYIVSLRTHDDHRLSKFIVLANNMKSAIKMEWKHGGPDFSIALRQVHWARAGNERGRATRFVIV